MTCMVLIDGKLLIKIRPVKDCVFVPLVTKSIRWQNPSNHSIERFESYIFNFQCKSTPSLRAN